MMGFPVSLCFEDRARQRQLKRANVRTFGPCEIQRRGGRNVHRDGGKGPSIWLVTVVLAKLVLDSSD